jgi:adenine-specific DNA-methyltransferase
MPTLHWIGKDKVINHHMDVPFKVLEHSYGFDNGTQTEQETNSGNKIIHGDNLEALKALLPEYEGKVKCIYIDPPYNTGNESWVYNDNVNDPKIKKWLGQVVGKEAEDLTRHDKWLCMMYPRLKLLQKLLSDDGVIFISIDDNEQANLKLICDEIFGGRNLVANIMWQKIHSIKNDAKFLSVNHDFVMLYSKNISSFKINLLERSEKMDSRYKNPDNDPRGSWQSGDLVANEPRKDGNYDVIGPSGKIFNVAADKHWVYSKENLMKMIDENRIWFGKDGTSFPRKKRFLTEVQQGRTPDTWWMSEEVGHNQEAKREIKGILEIDNQTFSTPKPIRLMERVVQISTEKNSIILDSFAGSGTTAHAVLNLNKQDGGNRKFICIEMEDYAE